MTELETKLESERESLAEAEALLEAGKCPECGQDVAESPHVDSMRTTVVGCRARGVARGRS
ncbi:hypothetical protein C9J85_09450 [Haloferax sp. wsp5]|nr:hypothetical protein C9J85_09450 [Haloferax sp. wsp5]